MGGSSHLILLVGVWLALLGLFFWMVVRPHRKRISEHQQLMEGLGRGDRIVTAGGLYGHIVGLQEKTVTLEIAKGVQVVLDRRAIRRKCGEGEEDE
jgi:preprotein translocase subunit YajC